MAEVPESAPAAEGELPAPGRPGAGPGPTGGHGWRAWAAPAAVTGALAYGAWQAYWALGNAPPFALSGTDLVVFSGWGAVGLCAVAAGVAFLLSTASRPSRPRLLAVWGVSAALVVNCPLLLLDVVGGLLPGLGIPSDPPGFLSRAACLTEGALLAAAATASRRRWWGEGPRAARPGGAVRPARPPWWAWLGAYGAVAACGVRLLAQSAVGFGTAPLQGGASLLVFEAGFVLAGTVLPLALVHAWGRTFPRWVPGLAGRLVPRWLLLGPAFAIAGALTVYFGVGLVQLAVETARGAVETGPLPLAFFWVAVPAYLVWGLGLGAAALAYERATRP